jgi:hypothetical protein
LPVSLNAPDPNPQPNLGAVPEKHTRALPGNTATLARSTTQIQAFDALPAGASRMTDNETLDISNNRPVG